MNNEKEIIERLERIEQKIQNPDERPLSLKEAAAHLDLSQSYLYKLTSQARIPHYKPEGKRVYFKRSELDEWLLRNPVRTKEEIGKKASSYVLKHRSRP